MCFLASCFLSSCFFFSFFFFGSLFVLTHRRRFDGFWFWIIYLLFVRFLLEPTGAGGGELVSRFLCFGLSDDVTLVN